MAMTTAVVPRFGIKFLNNNSDSSDESEKEDKTYFDIWKYDKHSAHGDMKSSSIGTTKNWGRLPPLPSLPTKKHYILYTKINRNKVLNSAVFQAIYSFLLYYYQLISSHNLVLLLILSILYHFLVNCESRELKLVPCICSYVPFCDSSILG